MPKNDWVSFFFTFLLFGSGFGFLRAQLNICCISCRIGDSDVTIFPFDVERNNCDYDRCLTWDSFRQDIYEGTSFSNTTSVTP